ncbi:hypothetical protein BUALT_Bualt12G0040000 [Buddleja alternifolia]|uniref:3'-5' exonuclease domain-containing protein n=1 Tax=Buddleja alternifolia TaxID=168488 RepID=A0AAV6WWJ6_9LAMI|nr:hypothetical protein BUALT_Bualt12G0040000 [Buddleja alternifolia]
MAINIEHLGSSFDDVIYTHDVYIVSFFNDDIYTTVTHDPDTVSKWISEIERIHRRRLIVGFDIKWSPSYSRHRNPVATLHLSVGRRCLIYQLLHSPYIPDSLINFLSDQNHTFVGVNIDSDLIKLEEDYRGFGATAVAVDLRDLAAEAYERNDLENAGLRELARGVLGKNVEMPRRVTMCRWDKRWLTAEQVKYGCVDAYVSFEIGRVLINSSYHYDDDDIYYDAAADDIYFDAVVRKIFFITITTVMVLLLTMMIRAKLRPFVLRLPHRHHRHNSQPTPTSSLVTEWIILTESINRNVTRVTVGLDVQWRPSYFPRGNPVAVLQICVGDRCLVYQIIHAPYIPDALRNFFFHQHYTFVGVGVKSDLDKLVEDYGIGRHAKAVELAKVAAKTYV